MRETRTRDERWSERFTLMCEIHSNIADKYPDLSQITPQQHDKVIVFEHGTLSCGLEGLQHFENLAVPVYRYEHDTFARIETNGTELADLIRENIDAKQLLIIAHSRGGLVARIAIAKLRPTYEGAVQLFTFGTTHRGTPLVNVGSALSGPFTIQALVSSMVFRLFLA
jgi:triacylglycerol esterase/lipase EstA (alpha/beta hydrolase family)